MRLNIRYTMECRNRLGVGVLVLKTLACRGLRVGPSKCVMVSALFCPVSLSDVCKKSGLRDGTQSLGSQLRPCIL